MALDSRISKLVYKFVDPKDKAWANFTKKRNLTMAGLAKPTDITGQIIPLIATERTISKGQTPLQDFTRGAGNQRTITSTEWTWQLRGSSYRPLVILEDISTSVYPGINRSTFKVKVDCNIPLKGSVLTFEGPKKFQARVQTDGYTDGDGYVFELQIMTDDPTMYIPKSLLRPGRLVNCMWATYGEASIDDGPTKYMPNAVFKLRSWLTQIRKQYKVTGHAQRQKLDNGAKTHLIIAGTDDKGKKVTPTYWDNLANLEFEAELNMEREYALFYSRSTKSVLDLSSAEVVMQGPGLEELMEDSNIFRYNTFSLSMVEDFLQGIFYNRVAFKDRHILMMTGERGLLKWERAIRDVANGQFSDMSKFFIDAFTGNQLGDYPSQNSGSNTSKSGARYNANQMAFGAYYTTYRMFPGGSITVAHLPILDDPRIHLDRDDEGFPIESSKFYIWDLGFSGDLFASKNLEYINLENGTSRWSTYGAYTPKGPNINNEYPATHTGDYYSIHHLEHLGIQLTDAKMAGVLIPNSQLF